MHLTILICTHNRVSLFERVLSSLNAARRPERWAIDILVVANACSDGTTQFLENYQAQMEPRQWLPLTWISEPTPGKSFALNRAIPILRSDIVAFVDDDHRVDPSYLIGICTAAQADPEATLFCGRIVPDWTGEEPRWAHDDGPYRIYPPPVPRFDRGDKTKRLTMDEAIPGGGNLALRREVFDRIGLFSTELGPHGHDLGGGEDLDFVLRAFKAGQKLRYAPDMIQYHYVDLERFTLRYMMQKSYQRTRSAARLKDAPGQGIPRYMWRKLAEYLMAGFVSVSLARTRFYLIRVAAVLGEMHGALTSPRPQSAGRENIAGLAPPDSAGHWGISAWLGAATLLAIPVAHFPLGFALALAVAVLATGILTLKSVMDFSQTGPQIKREIVRHYGMYFAMALARLSAWALVLVSLMATAGFALYGYTVLTGLWEFHPAWATIAAILGIALLTGLQFCHHLLYLPATIAASSHYRLSRLYPLWHWLSPRRLALAGKGIYGFAAVIAGATGLHLLAKGKTTEGIIILLGVLTVLLGSRLRRTATDVGLSSPKVRVPSERPNIVMIGSDTLRADRMVTAGYHRRLTPFIDSLAMQGTQFTSCYVPCARTAPSLVSLFTGTWPHTHGVRDNFVADADTRLRVAALPEILARHGYRTAAVSDWSGGDLRKFALGFEQLDLPDDQWNIKYLIRQGPKDLRLFLSLFTHNRFGKRVLPELYYLAGIPLTSLIGRDARALISEFADRDEPFLLNVFVSTTHPPFGSEYPYYTLWSDKDYSGESKFVMARLTDPWEIIRRQGDSKKEFDLDQIIDLYDGCVRNFDDEVKRIVEHVKACGLEDNTIIVIYSDHGMEFFEHDTWGQGNSVRGDFSARIPLVILDPRLKVQVSCPHVVRSVDVAPTLLELAGIAPPASADGVSLVPYLRGGATDMNLAAFNETGIWLTDVPGMSDKHLRYPNLLDLLEVPDTSTGTLAIKPEYREAIITAKDRMVRVGSWKLIYYPTSSGPLYALFNLATDPYCRHDLAAEHPEIFRQLRDLLMHWMGWGRTAASMPEDKAAAPIG